MKRIYRPIFREVPLELILNNMVNKSQIESKRQEKEDIEQWSRGKTFSKAKTYLKLQLEGDDNWVTRIIADDPGVSAKTIDKIQDMHDLFRPYKKQNFRANFRSLKKAIDKNAAAVSFDQNAFNKELTKYQKEPLLKVGYPRWNHPQNTAKKLLENDMKPGGLYNNPDMKPSELRELRPEYQRFPKKVFQDRLFREHRKQKETPFWVHKRNKKMRKKAIDHEIQALVVQEASQLYSDK